MKNVIILGISLILLSACSRGFDGSLNPPLLYKIDIQQGNVVDQEMLNKLKPGMLKEQVRFIMGTPVLVDPFHTDRWEYIFSFQEGGKVREQRHITVYFKDDKLSHISGDIEVSDVPLTQSNVITEEEAIVVPEGSHKKKEKGFFGKIWDKITPGED